MRGKLNAEGLVSAKRLMIEFIQAQGEGDQD